MVEDYTQPPEEPIEPAELSDDELTQMADEAAEQARAEMETEARAEALAAIVAEVEELEQKQLPDEEPPEIDVEERLPPELDAQLRSMTDGAIEEMAQGRRSRETEIFGRGGMLPDDWGEPSIADLTKPPPIYDEPHPLPDEGEQSFAEQETDALRERVVRLEGLLATQRHRGVLLPTGAKLLWGKAIAAWTSGNTITLDPCDEDGNDSGASNVDVYVEAPTAATPVNVQVAASDVLPYFIRADGDGQALKFHRPHRTATGDSVNTLDWTQATADTDTYTWGSASGGVGFRFVTDIQYSSATHVLAFRTRSGTTDKYGHVVTIGSESGLTTIATAESCP